MHVNRTLIGSALQFLIELQVNDIIEDANSRIQLIMGSVDDIISSKLWLTAVNVLQHSIPVATQNVLWSAHNVDEKLLFWKLLKSRARSHLWLWQDAARQ